MKASLFLVFATYTSNLFAHDIRAPGIIPDDFLNLPRVGAPTDPEQLFLNYGPSPSSMVISWATNSTADSMVEYGLTSSFGSTATGNYTQYSAIGYTSPYLHMATMTNLQPSTTYYYHVGGPNSGWSATYSFTSSPVVGANYPYKVGVMGDLGQTMYSNNTIYHVLQANVDVSVLVGDLSYADSTFHLWDSFGRMLSGLTSSVPLMTAMGNHELEIAVPPTVSYDTRYRGMPSQNGPEFYSFESGPLHMIALNSFGIYSVNSPQYNWLLQDLAQVDRTKTPWVCVMLHAPWYNSNTQHTTDGQPMRETLEQILYDNKVAMVLAGHVHAFERTFSVYNNTLDASGITFVTIGDGGSPEGLYKNWINPQPEWSAVRESIYGHGILNILNNTHMSWEWHELSNSEPIVSDQAYIINPYKN